jgi:hypothetical protein
MLNGLHVALYRDDSFVHWAEVTERVSTYCLVSDGSLSGADFQVFILRPLLTQAKLESVCVCGGGASRKTQVVFRATF